MPAILLPFRDCDYSPPHSRSASRLVRASLLCDQMRDPLLALQKLKNRATKRQTVSFESSAGAFISYSYENSSFCTSLADINAGGRDSSRFEREMGRSGAMLQHKAIEFRQRFLALPEELRNQIYDAIISSDTNNQAHRSLYHQISGRFVYRMNEGQPRGRSLTIRSIHPQPQSQDLQFIREGDHIWNELMDRWISESEIELFQSLTLNWSDGRKDSHESLNCFYQPLTADAAFPRPIRLIELFPPERLHLFQNRRLGSCSLNLSIHNVPFNFAEAASNHLLQSPLYILIQDVATHIKQTIKTTDLRIKLSLWPGEYLDKSSHGWAPYFESDEDVEGLWSILKPLKEVAGVQSIRVKRLKGNALWSKQPNSLYPEDPPLIIVEKVGVSISGWLDFDRGWGTQWDWGVLGDSIRDL